MTSWAALIATATVGTDRQAGSDPDEVLTAAAAHAACRRAGQTATTGLPAAVVAPPERRPVVPAAAARRLAGLLVDSSQDWPELLAQWLRLAEAAGRRVPPELLPALMDIGLPQHELRPLIVATGGERVSWLAAQRERWRFLASVEDRHAGDDPAVWSAGSLGQRIGFLTAARQRDPDAARDRLAAEWSRLPPDERAALLGTFTHGLGSGDEDFLEAALDDRRKQVRDIAVDLLARLPESRYGERMAARARACLHLDAGQLRVTPPSECDRGMRRDGIATKAPRGEGERASWLAEIIARTPLSTWDLSLATARCDDGWAGPVRGGLIRATAAQRDARWAAILLDQLLAARGESQHSMRSWVSALTPALPPEQLLTRAESLLAGEPGGMTWLVWLLEPCPAPWPVALGDALLIGLARLAGAREGYLLDGLCRLAALRLPPQLAGPAAELASWADELAGPAELADSAGRPDVGRRALARLAETLRFRHEMTEELTCPQ